MSSRELPTPFIDCLGFIMPALLSINIRQACQAYRNLGMLGPKDFLVNDEAAFEKRFRLPITAWGRQEESKVI